MKFEIPEINLKQYLIICNNEKSSFFKNTSFITSYKNCKICKANKDKLCWINAIKNILETECYYNNIMKYLYKHGCPKCENKEIQINFLKKEICCPKCKTKQIISNEILAKDLQEEFEEIDKNEFITAINKSINNIYKYDYKNYKVSEFLEPLIKKNTY